MHGGLALNTISARAVGLIQVRKTGAFEHDFRRVEVPEIVDQPGRCWHALYTEPRCELLVRWAINALGFEAYVPTYRVEVRHARKVRVDHRPAFTRYVFARFDANHDEWGCIGSVRGVLRPVTNNSIPVRVPDDVIDEVKRLETIGWFDKLSSKSRFEPGETVRVIDGPMADRLVQFAGDHGKSVQVLMEILGGKVPVDMPLEFLEKV